VLFRSIHYPILDNDHEVMQGQEMRVLAMPQAVKATAEIFSLPCYAGIRSEELDHIQQVFDLYISKIV